MKITDINNILNQIQLEFQQLVESKDCKFDKHRKIKVILFERIYIFSIELFVEQLSKFSLCNHLFSQYA